MKLQYQLNEQDLIQYQFYLSSQSKQQRRKRMRSRFMIPVLYLGLAIYSYAIGSIPVGMALAGIGLLWFLVYPFYSKGLYKRYYKRYVKENYNDQLHKAATLTITKTAIETLDEGGNTTLKMNAISELVAIPEYYIIHLAPNKGILVPAYAVSDTETFVALFTGAGVAFKNLSDWKWK